MFASQRKQQILQILAVEKQVMSGELSQRFNVSEDSIRRDLRELAGEGKLQRVHGGALPVSAAIAPIETRKNVQIASKQAIARRAAALIQPGQVVIIDGGTTTEEMVRCLPADLACTVVTHSPGIAVALVERPLIEVILIGGGCLNIRWSPSAPARWKVLRGSMPICFLWALPGCMTARVSLPAIMKRRLSSGALAARAAETIVMASQEKLNSASAFAIGELSLAST
ncbi:Glycerol-3-phosphate regulon repressor [Raoultella ornithinolytica]|nr:Glycerol-3-phosphate regulon repressor [Raoultella ornithinolytica]